MGSGGFCSVYEARAFHPSADTDFELSSSQVQARAALSHNTNSRRHKESQYAVKVLRSDLMRNPKKFRIAAKDIEVRKLHFRATSCKHRSRILTFTCYSQHDRITRLVDSESPNIIKLRGCALGTGLFDENLQHDRCFLIMDRLDGTLDDRIIRMATRDKTPQGLQPAIRRSS